MVVRRAAGQTVEGGTVSSVRLGTDKAEATAIVGGVSVPMGRITEVSTSAK